LKHELILLLTARHLLLTMLAVLLACLAAWVVSPALATSSSDIQGSCQDIGVSQIDLSRQVSLPQPEDCSLPSPQLPVDFARLPLPDLRTLPPFDLKIILLPGGSRELRLSNTVWNSGEARLELEGLVDPAVERARVVQRVYAQTGLSFERTMGEFVWHPEHSHWHFDRFSLYELWRLSPDGRLEELVSSSDKVSYCVIDTDVADQEIEGFSPLRRFRGCGRTLQGLSVGWGDTYKSHLDGQSIPLDGVGDGLYVLRSTVNPDAILLESSYLNNTGMTFFEIKGDKIVLIDLEEYAASICQRAGGRVLQVSACWD
jgi:hypothetical protein